MKSNKLYQASTLQALALGYTKPVVTVQQLLGNGDIGLGTFESVDGEMIILDGVCYQAKNDGSVVRTEDAAGVPFAVAGTISDGKMIKMENMQDIEAIKTELTLSIDLDFSLNSIHVARIDGWFEKVHARAGAPYRSQHVSLKNILSKTQKDFCFEGLYGTLVCVYLYGRNKRFGMAYALSLEGQKARRSRVRGQNEHGRMSAAKNRQDRDPAAERRGV